MNTTQEKAKKTLDSFLELQKDMRNYENQNWHCVDVKRRSDYVDIEKLLEKEFSEFSRFFEDVPSNDNAFEDEYYYFLENAWEMLEEDFRKEKYNYIIENSWSKKHILSLGHSGGWACFQSSIDESVEDDIQSIIDGDNPDEDIDNATIKDAQEAIDEIIKLKNYINQYNKSLSWYDELKWIISDMLANMEYEDKELKESPERLKLDMQAITKKQLARLELFKGEKKLKSEILRNVKSIEKLTM